MTRLLLADVTVTRNAKTITCNMRWQGGQDHTITLPAPKTAWELRQTPPHVVEAIDQLLDHHTHAEIAAILNARGHTSGEGRPFNPPIVAIFTQAVSSAIPPGKTIHPAAARGSIAGPEPGLLNRMGPIYRTGSPR
jgi:hypothetical protein